MTVAAQKNNIYLRCPKSPEDAEKGALICRITIPSRNLSLSYKFRFFSLILFFFALYLAHFSFQYNHGRKITKKHEIAPNGPGYRDIFFSSWEERDLRRKEEEKK